MPASDNTMGEFLCDIAVNNTEVVEYGISMEALFSGKVSVPLAGARFDIHVKGAAHGPKLNGAVVGVDHLLVRADGHSQLHIHARITTEDGQNIALFADGVAVPQKGTTFLQLRESFSFLTASQTYTWLNTVQGWALGTVDPGKGEVRLKVYAAQHL